MSLNSMKYDFPKHYLQHYSNPKSNPTRMIYMATLDRYPNQSHLRRNQNLNKRLNFIQHASQLSNYHSSSKTKHSNRNF